MANLKKFKCHGFHCHPVKSGAVKRSKPHMPCAKIALHISTVTNITITPRWNFSSKEIELGLMILQVTATGYLSVISFCQCKMMSPWTRGVNYLIDKLSKDMSNERAAKISKCANVQFRVQVVFGHLLV